MASVPQNGRWQSEFDPEAGVDRVEFTCPGDPPEQRPTFAHQPARLTYDRHGYEASERCALGAGFVCCCETHCATTHVR